MFASQLRNYGVPIRGPHTDATENVAPTNPLNMLLFSSGVVFASMMNAPPKIPAEPTPDTARPTMSTIEVGAEPQIALPMRYISSDARNVHFGLKSE